MDPNSGLAAFLGIPIVPLIFAAAVAFIMQGVKRFNLSGHTIRFVAIGLCIVLATGYYFGANAAWWPSFLKILAYATMIWGVIIKPLFEGDDALVKKLAA